MGHEIIPYFSRTGTKRNLDLLRAAGFWRILVSATGALRTEGFPYAIDNGAWSAFQAGTWFDELAFMRVLLLLGCCADWVAVPDIVAGGQDSLAFSLTWLRTVLAHTRRALIPVQDGVELADVEHLLSDRVGIFVGGDPRTDWKERTTPAWARACRARGAWCHVGRVNTARRINLCAAAGVTSCDGTSASKFADSIPLLNRTIRQQSLSFTEEN